MIHTNTLAGNTLLTVARQRMAFDEQRCRLVFTHLETAGMLHQTLHGVLAKHHLSDLKLAVLAVLFALDPDPITPANLAFHTASSRPAITDAVDQLVALGLADRERDTQDRRAIYVSLTDSGRTVINETLNDYLRAAGEVARFIDPDKHTDLLNNYASLREGCAQLPSS